MTGTRPRRTVAGMDARLARARRLIERLVAESEARAAAGDPHENSDYAKGSRQGYRLALDTLDWAFAPDQDWMNKP